MAPAQVVFPGDEIAIAEEFLPGAGAYEEDGRVYAARLGVVHLDAGEFTAEVRPVTNVPVILKPGDRVIGVVQSLRTTMAIVEVKASAENPDRAISGDTNGTLHISKVAEYYVENLEDAFLLGDLIRAEVISVDPSLQLSTRAPHLGVLKSHCPRCRTHMEARGEGLLCPECEWKERSKLANDYGRGHVLPEA